MSKLFIYTILSMPFVGAFALFAVGIVVIYRASRVLNLAHGAMAMLPAYVVYSLSKAGLPIPLALVVGIGSGALLGLLVERIFVRALRSSLTAQTVGTVAVLSLLIALVAKIWGTAPRQAPQIFPKGFITVGKSHLQYGAIGLFITAAALAVAALALFKYTDLGLAMRGSAENRRAASLMGINPDRTTAIAWAIGGALAAVSGILLAAITILTPYDLPLQTLPAFVAALLGGIESLSGALVGSAVVGVIYGVVPATSNLPLIKNVTGTIGGEKFVLTLVALFVMYRRGQRFSVASRDDGGFASAGTRSSRARRSLPFPVTIGLVVALVGWIWLPGVPYSVMANANQAMIFAVVGVSLVILTGWVGQISLGQAALVGIGAFTTGVLARRMGVPFPYNLPIAALVSAAAASLLGAVALRVRGLYLAVATLIFSWMADSFLFRNTSFVGSGGSSTIDNTTIGAKGGFPYFDFSDRKVLYYFGLAIMGLALIGAANLRSSKTGRAWYALRGSETAAASLGVNVMRYKLLAFAISGMLAGAAGNMIIIDQRTAVPDQFKFTVSLFFLSIAVVGGLTSLPGVVVASVLFAGLNEMFLRVSFLQGWLEVVSAGLLVAAILAQGHRARFDALRAAVAKPLARLLVRQVGQPAAGTTVPEAGPETVPEAEPVEAGAEIGLPVVNVVAPAVERTIEVLPVVDGAPRRRHDVPLLLEGREITVQFGGLTAVSNATIEIYQGEIVGLIGPNGAGKTTLFNALSGLNEPARGVVRLFGRDVSDAPVHERARLGLARTFQALQLFGDMTVRENMLVATHAHDRTGFVRHLLATDAAISAEREGRQRVQDVIDLLDLHDIADRPAAGLPFGLLRLVELGRAVVTGAPVILLDEPASGLDNTETDRFTAFLRDLRDRTGVTMLLIEHDVKMVTGVSDYMYVLNMGELIAQGVPEQVQRDRAVMAAYLGEPEGDETVDITDTADEAAVVAGA